MTASCCWGAVAYVSNGAYLGLWCGIAVLVVIVAAVLIRNAQHGQPEPDEDQAQRREVVPLATKDSHQSIHDQLFARIIAREYGVRPELKRRDS
jgi:hypothetical protein